MTMSPAARVRAYCLRVFPTGYSKRCNKTHSLWVQKAVGGHVTAEIQDDLRHIEDGFTGDLEAGLAATWQVLCDGVTQRRSPFHLMTVATVSSGGDPQVRTVVLRGCDQKGKWLRFNTDSRSPKIDDIESNPSASLLFYGAKEKLQIRLKVKLERVGVAERDEMWARTPSYSRECYQVTTAPGSDVRSPEATQFDAHQADGGRENFAPIRARVDELEWLYLSAKRHRRAHYIFTESGVKARWVVP